MKKTIFILLIALVVGAFAQTWGEQKLIFGTTFENATDQLKLKVSGMTDTVLVDTLYTRAIPITKSTGIYGITAQFDTLQGASSSILLDVRLLAVFTPKPQQGNFWTTYTPRAKTIARGSWQALIGSMGIGTLYTVSIAQSDCSWWKPNYNHLQYRLRETDADTSFHNILEFRDLEDTIK